MKNQSQRGIVPRKIKGFRDIDASLNSIRWKIIEAASKVYKLYGFEHLDTPVLEYADALGKYMPDTDTVDRGVYSFKNPEIEPVYRGDGKELRDDAGNVVMEHHFLSLRYDLTAPLSRVFAEKLWNNYLKQGEQQMSVPLFRRYQFGPVFRFEAKLDPGRFREFWQLDFDSVGTANVAADAEVCMILSDALKAIGLHKSDFKIKVNNRKILKGFLSSIGVEKEDQEQSILRVVDKLDKIGIGGIEEELGVGRTDRSGAFVAGLELDSNRINKVLSFIESFMGTSDSRALVLSQLESHVGNSSTFKEGLSELLEIDTFLNSVGLNSDSVIYEPTLVRGMAYYTGPIFEVESTKSYTDSKGNVRHVGSICGGGRYDGLVENLLGMKAPATGASIGVDRLAELLVLTEQNRDVLEGPVFIALLDYSMMREYQDIAASLRRQGVETEIYYGAYAGFKKLKKQLSYADKKKCPVAILLGENESSKGVVSLRNLKLGKLLSSEISDKREWRRRVQTEVPKENVVQSVVNLLNK